MGNSSFQQYIDNTLNVIEDVSQPNTSLDIEIFITEVVKAINTLKSGKSCGLDLISSDMIKCCRDLLAKPICHLFNSIFNTGKFPSNWNTDIMVPIHKSGSVNDPANYRHIVLSSILYKLFSKILCTRISAYFETENPWSENQCGFKPRHRTEDNIFIIKTLFENMFYIMVKNYMLLLFI